MARHRGRPEFAVIGLGRFGTGLALRLIERGYCVLGIDRNPEVVQRMADSITQAVVLDATDEQALHDIGITDFDAVIVAIGTDFEANLMTTVALKTMGVQHVVCKALNERQSHVLGRVGADRVILPELEAGQRLAEELTSSTIVEMLARGQTHAVLEIEVPPQFVGHTLRELDLRKRHGITVLVVKRGHVATISPGADFVLEHRDVLAILGSNEDVQLLSRPALTTER